MNIKYLVTLQPRIIGRDKIYIFADTFIEAQKKAIELARIAKNAVVVDVHIEESE